MPRDIFAEWFETIADDPPGVAQVLEQFTTDPLPQAPVPLTSSSPRPVAPDDASEEDAPAPPIRAVPEIDEVLARIPSYYGRLEPERGEARVVGPLPPPSRVRHEVEPAAVMVTDSVMNGRAVAVDPQSREIATVLTSPRTRAVEREAVPEWKPPSKWRPIVLIVAAALAVCAVIVFLRRSSEPTPPPPPAASVATPLATASIPPPSPSAAAAEEAPRAPEAAPEPSTPAVAAAASARTPYRGAPRALPSTRVTSPAAPRGSASSKPSPSIPVPYDQL